MCVYTCQNATLLEIICHASFYFCSSWAIYLEVIKDLLTLDFIRSGFWKIELSVMYIVSVSVCLSVCLCVCVGGGGGCVCVCGGGYGWPSHYEMMVFIA